MGRAVITANRGEGLYRIRLLYDLGPLEKELSGLRQKQTEYSGLLLKSLNTLELLRDDVAIAADAKNAVIEQWQQDLISKTAAIPPPIPPPTENDPETGQPWTDPDRAQEKPLLDLINAMRASSLVRDEALDRAARIHLSNQAGTGSIGHLGAYQSKPADRVLQQGFNAETVAEALHYGAHTPAQVVTEWRKDPSTLADLLNADATKAGIAYRYAPHHPHTHLWCALVVKPGAGPLPSGETIFPPDPAKKAAEEAETKLERIEPPRTGAEVPVKMGEAVAKYALAVAKKLAAERDLAELMVEKLERDSRISELEGLKESLLETEIDAWCCTYTHDLEVGAEVGTLDVPGDYRQEATPRLTTMKRNTPQAHTVAWTERSLNIAPTGLGGPPHGKLRATETMEPVAVAYNLMLEPGHLKWRPRWRYGTITALDNNEHLCDVSLTPISARRFDDETRPLDLNATAALQNVPIRYQPCGSWAFDVGDEVLVAFGGNRDTPTVIGFRREPRDCSGRIGWIQMGF